MGLDTTHEQLETTWKRLQLRWDSTSAVWDDEVHDRFEKEYWGPLEAQTPATLRAMSALAQVIAKARRSIR